MHVMTKVILLRTKAFEQAYALYFELCTSEGRDCGEVAI
jgi:hypothetical protein